MGRLKEAAYTTVGLGLLGMQRLQVQRREITKAIEPQVREAAVRLEKVASAADEALDPVLDRFEHDLPEATADVVRSARAATKAARDAALARAAGRRRT